MRSYNVETILAFTTIKDLNKLNRRTDMFKYHPRPGSTPDESLNHYFGGISKIPLLTPEEEGRLATQIRKGNKKAFIKLVRSNLRFVVRVALEYRNQGLPLEDLINEGNLGLIKAARRYDESKGFKFISYAVWWIRQSILQALSEHARIVRLPVNRVSTLNRIGKKQDSLQQVFEREPTAEEVADSLNLSLNDINWIFNFPDIPLSFDAPLSDKQSSNLLELTEDQQQILPDQPIADESLKRDIKKALESLSNKESEILRLYFGINEKQTATLDEIANKLKMTRERVRQIKEKAIVKLRHQSRSKLLRQYLG